MWKKSNEKLKRENVYTKGCCLYSSPGGSKSIPQRISNCFAENRLSIDIKSCGRKPVD